MIQSTRNQFEDTTRTLLPKACQDERLVAAQVFDEYIIYDLEHDKVHNLNTTAAEIWQWCDGSTSIAALAARLAVQHNLPKEHAELLLWLTLDRLEKARLMEHKISRPANVTGISRRQVLQRIGVAMLLPVVYSIVAPTAAQAMSLLQRNSDNPCR